MSSYEDIRAWRRRTAEQREDLKQALTQSIPQYDVKLVYSDMDVFTVAFANELDELEHEAYTMRVNAAGTKMGSRGTARVAMASEGITDVLYDAISATLTWRDPEESKIFRAFYEDETRAQLGEPAAERADETAP